MTGAMANSTGPRPTEITQRGLFQRVVFDDEGLTIVPLLWKGFRVAWTEVEFVCVTPAMVRDAQGWREKPNDLLGPDFRSTFATHGSLELSFVVRDRRVLLARADGFWNRSTVAAALEPMLDAQNRLRPDQALLRIQVTRRRLDRPIDDLLDLLAKHCRFDLVVDF